MCFFIAFMKTVKNCTVCIFTFPLLWGLETRYEVSGLGREILNRKNSEEHKIALPSADKLTAYS